jgi:hypothetical protein
VRRIRIVFLAGLIAVAAVAVLFAAMPARADTKQQALSRYFARRMTTAGQPLRAGRQVRAANPGALDDSLGAATYGSGIYYHTTFDYSAAPASAPAPVRTVQFMPAKGDSLRPLPYPPREVWCVWLVPPDDSRSPVVLLARHQDLYNAEWIVHEPLADAGDTSELVLALGCDVSE